VIQIEIRDRAETREPKPVEKMPTPVSSQQAMLVSGLWRDERGKINLKKREENGITKWEERFRRSESNGEGAERH